MCMLFCVQIKLAYQQAIKAISLGHAVLALAVEKSSDSLLLLFSPLTVSVGSKEHSTLALTILVVDITSIQYGEEGSRHPAVNKC